MKILTGYLKGKTLIFEPAAHLRPTSDKLRKAVFDVLQGHAAGKRVLDLYSGTGAMGFEALSQKAARVTFVENEPSKAKRIEAVAKRLGVQESADVLCLHALRAVERLKLAGQTFDLVFADPPYGEKLGVETLRSVAESGILAEAGFVFVETGRKEDLPEKIAGFMLVRDRLYGQSRMRIYRKEAR